MVVANCQGQLQIMGLAMRHSPPGGNLKVAASIKKEMPADRVPKGNQCAAQKFAARIDLGSERSDSASEQEAPPKVSTQRRSVQSKSSGRSGPSGIPKRVSCHIDALNERLSMQQEELRCVKVQLWESKAESGHGPWDQMIQAVKSASGDSLESDAVKFLDGERHRYKRKWQLACMMLKYKI
jgi:hypothetical protein